MQEAWVWSLCQEDPLVKEMITHYGILAWRIPWTEKPGVLTSRGSQRVNTAGRLTLSLYFSPISGFVSIWKKKKNTYLETFPRQCDDIRRFWEVMMVRWGREGRAVMNWLVPLSESGESLLCSAVQRSWHLQLEKVLSPEPSYVESCSWTLSFRNCEE